MALVEWLLTELVKIGGPAALKKAVSHVQKYEDGATRAEKMLLAGQLSTTIVRSIVMGQSTLDEPLRPLIRQFRQILGDGVRVVDSERTLEIIEEAEGADREHRRLGGFRPTMTDRAFGQPKHGAVKYSPWAPAKKTASMNTPLKKAASAKKAAPAKKAASAKKAARAKN